MRQLINDQTIDFDIHRAGDGQAISVDGLHMHKRMNGKKYKGVDVLFPLDHKEEVEFRPKNTPTVIQRQIIKEIQRAIKKNQSKKFEFIEIIMSEIERHINSGNNDENAEVIRRGAERIANVFAKEGKIRDEIQQKIESKIQYFITSHKKDNGGIFYIKQDLARNRIKIGDDLEALNYGNEKRKFL
jgi:hypothetical protein